MLRASRNISRLQCLPHQLAAVQRNSLSSQQPSLKTPPPPQPPPLSQAIPKRQRRSGGWFWKLGGFSLFMGVGGVIGYAWYDDQFRKDFETHVLFGRGTFEHIMPYLPDRDALMKKFPWLEKKPGIGSSAIGTPFHLPMQGRSASASSQQVAIPDAPKEDGGGERHPTSIPPVPVPITNEKAKAEAAERRRKEMEESENAALEILLNNGLVDARLATQSAIDKLNEAANSVTRHTEALREAMEASGKEKSEEAEWVAMTTAHARKMADNSAAEAKKDRANDTLEAVRKILKDGRSNSATKKNSSLSQSEQEVNKLGRDLGIAEGKLSRVQTAGRVMSEYNDLVHQGREQFKKELESLHPDVKMGSRFTGKLSEEELNNLIAHAHRRIAQLQRQLMAKESAWLHDLDSAIEKQQTEDEIQASEELERERQRLAEEYDTERSKWEDNANAEFERRLRVQLVRQATAHSDHLAEVLRRNEAQVEQRYAEQLRVGLLEERGLVRAEVVDSVARLHGIEAAIEERADMEKESRRAQELWIASVALQSLVDLGNTSTDQCLDPSPLSHQVSVIAEAAGTGDPLVSAVLRSLSAEALDRGVWPRQALADRFCRIREVARRVVLVGDVKNASLLRYIASYITSMFVVRDTSEDDIIPANVTSFWLLDHAERSAECGDIAQALRFANQLSGAPRRVAADWIAEARLYLEAKQAADALLAHALASAISALQ